MMQMVVVAWAPALVAGRWGTALPHELLERLKDYGQEGAFAFWDELAPEERNRLIRDIEVISQDKSIYEVVESAFITLYTRKSPTEIAKHLLDLAIGCSISDLTALESICCIARFGHKLLNF